MKDTNAEVKAYLNRKIKPSSTKTAVLKAIDRIRRMGFYVEDLSGEYEYPNFHIRTAEAYVRVYRHSRLGWQIQPWEYTTFTYSGVPTFFGTGLMKGVRK